ncbi:SPX domain-containing protein [Hygrophoropsis aurantiaca]|uniref:SPX domain-containing protein n=1 Tax=Hygrophoropsis aurantiaca TaxID=72124 RepID=A0ACB8A7P2_9AGAM|nr:SPX domain-containing protein [Hygrophoropsis aurantiaca]
MHFSKTYSQLLLTLPPELRDNAIEYRQLKKLINQVVNELSSLGLSPTVLQQLIEQRNVPGIAKVQEIGGEGNNSDSQPSRIIVYEIANSSTNLEPRLRLSLKHPGVDSDPVETNIPSLVAPSGDAQISSVIPITILEVLQLQTQSATLVNFHAEGQVGSYNLAKLYQNGSRELVIPLRSDTAFFRLLTSALESLSTHLLKVHANFTATLHALSSSISHAARPSSSTSSFHPYSHITSNASSISVTSSSAKSDLYSWREIFQLYVEAEIFEGVGEANRGERSVGDSEERLRLFEQRLIQRDLNSKRKLKLIQSRDALDMFLKLNSFILDLKKFQFATSEATRKILKKHTKRTALPLPPSIFGRWDGYFSSLPSSATTHNPGEDLALIPQPSISLPRLLVQAMGTKLLPIVPHIDDYACLICTSIAFKPIRLVCGHLFCVRCLVKLQKRGKANCPMCRAPTVLVADRGNVDWALLNFMQDWFPVEARAKLKQNEREAAEEELAELGIDGKACAIM